MILQDAIETAEEVCDILRPLCLKIEIAGAIRRTKEEVRDIDIVLVRNIREIIRFKREIDKMIKVKGDPLGSYTIRLFKQVEVDIFMVPPETFGLQFAIRTGSRDYSRALAKRWVDQGYKSVSGYLHEVHPSLGVQSKRRGFETEEEFFDFLGVKYLEPRERIGELVLKH